MKSVLISIQPKFCELIANGEKTIEVRKTRPKIETPFKCYIYETKGKTLYWSQPFPIPYYEGKGKVIGEFICDKIIEYPYMTDGYSSSYGYLNITRDGLIMMHLEHSELETYGDGKTLYGWHISDLVIYDEPKKITKFMKPCDKDDFPCELCENVGFAIDNIREEKDSKNRIVRKGTYRMICANWVKKAPQSWCYVDELK